MPTNLHRIYHSGTVLLESTRRGEGTRRNLLFSNPVRQLIARRINEVEPLIRELDLAVEQGYYVAGFLGYEAGAAFLPVESREDGEVLAWFGVYREPEVLSPEECDAFFGELAGRAPVVGQTEFAYDREGYIVQVGKAKHHIREGDVYQVNFTGPFSFGYVGPPAALYAGLRERQRVPYSAFVNAGDFQLLSFSPELFFRRSGRTLRAEPMKGTVRRGRTLQEDRALAVWLAADEKSRAENLMIVDLLRNDLSVVCRSGTVRTPELFRTATYETLTQMTSAVEGELREEVGYADIFRALFPCGSVTGAPKIRAMQLINELEPEPRGVYCGAMGYAAPGEEAVFSVAIRTLHLQDGRGRMGVGSGIVADSDSDAEYEECLLKGQFLTGLSSPVQASGEPEFALIETMRWESGGIPLLDLHLGRLCESAAYFMIPCDEPEVRESIARATANITDGGARKVRLTLDGRGQLNVTVAGASTPGEKVGKVIPSSQAVDTSNVSLYHKTTRRELYEAAYREAAAMGYTEVLFLNERREVAEGSRTNVFVRVGEELLTPPLTSGLLPGVYRSHLLATCKDAREQVLFADDLRRADAVFVCNAVWGLVEVKLE